MKGIFHSHTVLTCFEQIKIRNRASDLQVHGGDGDNDVLVLRNML